jgi:Mn2+/Fe2+ NRAMP family transporter
MLAALVVANLTNVMANFAGVASSLGLFHVSKYISVPLCAAGVWFLILKTDYRRIEKVFLFATSLYVCYIVSAFLVSPDWKEAAIYSVRPVLMLDSGYIAMLIGMVGTSVAPWMQFFLQAAVVEKGVTAKEYKESRIEVVVGCIVMSVIAFFIIVSSAGAIWSNGPRDINDAVDAAEALLPFGPYAYLLFCAGLLNASVFAACILPLSTAYTVCEGLGFESGVNKTWKEAPVFYWLNTLLIAIGAGIILIPGFPLIPMILVSQIINGMLLPVILIFMTMLVNRSGLMREWTNSRPYNAVAWTAVIVMTGLTLALTAITLRDLRR